MKRISASELTENYIEAIGKEWMIVTAGDTARFNMMTASWGGIGWLWNKPVAFVFIRPERYTYGLSEGSDRMTLSFLGNSKEARNIYNLCGSKSGRDVDKLRESGLRLVPDTQGNVVYEQARLTLVCKKLYADDLKPEAFTDKTLDGAWYGKKGGYHKMYIVEITDVLVNE